MKQNLLPASAEAFFLDATPGRRFFLYHPPMQRTVYRGAFIYIHPFAEEMNKARRMAALQARAFSELGFAVLQIDLYGCGDSDGEFRDARWDIWIRDLKSAKEWLKKRVEGPVSLWGLRLGALLALDFYRQENEKTEAVVLWQPVLRGEMFMTQFLRLRMAKDMLTGQSSGGGTRALREALGRGDVLDIAGYEIAPELIFAIDALDASEWVIPDVSLHWLELMSGAAATPTLAPASESIAKRWVEQGADLQVHHVQGTPFWASQEVTICSDFLNATARIFDGGRHELP